MTQKGMLDKNEIARKKRENRYSDTAYGEGRRHNAKKYARPI